jgi:hypothetical protein
MTPRYKRRIQNQVVDNLNKVHQMFLERYPNFLERGGKFHFAGHSLGSIICFDILTTETVIQPQATQISHKEFKLNFCPSSFFTVGSPIGLFLILRNATFRGSTEEGLRLPPVSEKDNPFYFYQLEPVLLYNIFHPNDPIAYRLEPFLSMKCLKRDPYNIDYHKGGLKGLQNNIVGLGEKASQKWSLAIQAVSTKLQSFKPSMQVSEEASQQPTVEIRNQSKTIEKQLEQLNPNGRIDFSLQEDLISNQYMSSVSAHVDYWVDMDFAIFITRELCKDRNPSPDQTP